MRGRKALGLVKDSRAAEGITSGNSGFFSEGGEKNGGRFQLDNYIADHICSHTGCYCVDGSCWWGNVRYVFINEGCFLEFAAHAS